MFNVSHFRTSKPMAKLMPKRQDSGTVKLQSKALQLPSNTDEFMLRQPKLPMYIYYVCERDLNSFET